MKLTKCKLDRMLGAKKRTFGLPLFCIFGPLVIFSVIWFSIYSVLQIRSNGPAWKKKIPWTIQKLLKNAPDATVPLQKVLQKQL